MKDLILFLVIAVILFFAIRYIYREKKKGAACVGCPMAGKCAKMACACDGTEEKEDGSPKETSQHL